MDIIFNYDYVYGNDWQLYKQINEIEKILSTHRDVNEKDNKIVNNILKKFENGLLDDESDKTYSQIALLMSTLSNYSLELQTTNLSSIKSILNSNNIFLSNEEIFETLIFMLVNKGSIIRKDFWNKEPEYTLLTERYHDSSYTRNYYSFNCDSNEDKKFLLISDTHIGNNEIENIVLINNLYDYAIDRGASKCFHLGDLFEGNLSISNEAIDDFLRRMNKFKNEYPSPNPKEMMTYAIKGNHDKNIEKILNSLTYENTFLFHNDLRRLTILNPSFYMFPRDKWQSTFSSINFHFSHKLYISMMVEDLKIQSISEIQKLEEISFLDGLFKDINISGHLHKGFIYSIKDPYLIEKEKLFLGVPSTSNININDPVAYLISTHNKTNGKMDNIDISVLNCDNNNKIYESDVINWSFKNKNKTLRKLL